MASTLEQILTLEQLDKNLFRSEQHCKNFRNTLFGGQVLGQALMATYGTVGEELPNSLHAYFLRAGNSDTPVIYDVEKVRDGKSFITRRAVARQSGRPIFNLSASFHKPEEGFEHQDAFPEDIPTPETLLSQGKSSNVSAREFGKNNSFSPFDLLPISAELFSTKEALPPEGYFWIKTAHKLADDPIFHHCALAFASDLGLLATALLPHQATLFDQGIMAASVDHAMWFHNQNFRADEWLLCKTHSPWAGGARGFAIGSIYCRNGNLIATSTQEGLIRPI